MTRQMLWFLNNFLYFLTKIVLQCLPDKSYAEEQIAGEGGKDQSVSQQGFDKIKL